MEKIIIQPPDSVHVFLVGPLETGSRLDLYVTQQFSSYSRSFFEKLIENGFVAINDKPIRKRSISVSEGDTVVVNFPPAHRTSQESGL